MTSERNGPFLKMLSAAEQSALGLQSTWPCAYQDRVRFGEIDSFGHANNAVYMTWFETARVYYFQQSRLFENKTVSPVFVIRRAEIDYLHETRLDDAYVVTCRCSGFRQTSMTLEQELWVNARLHARSKGIFVLLCPDGRGKMPLPDSLVEILQNRDGARPEAMR